MKVSEGQVDKTWLFDRSFHFAVRLRSDGAAFCKDAGWD